MPLAGGATLRELALPAPRPAQVSVKAAVLPFARFPGADPVLGPEMRSTGEVMASGSDFASAFAKAERAAGRAPPVDGDSVRLRPRRGQGGCRAGCEAASPRLGFALVATSGHRAPRSRTRACRSRASRRAPTVVELVRRQRVDIVVNTPEGRNARATATRSARRR
jgi:carbamoyl-phosphate synthase large subunit